MDVKLELRSFTEQSSVIKVEFLPVNVHVFVEIEFDGVVTSSDGLDVPVNVLVGLNALDVVKVHKGVEIDKHYNASSE